MNYRKSHKKDIYGTTKKKFSEDKQISYPRHIAPTCARTMRGGWKTAFPIWRCNLKKM